jgi:hypothetical protein
MKRYYVCVNECGYKIGPYRHDFDDSMTRPNSHYGCGNCPQETISEENGIEVTRRPPLKPAHVYNQRELQKMRAAEYKAAGLPPGGFRPPKATSFGAGILDAED